MLVRKGHFSAAAVLMLLAGVQAQHGVTLSSQSICAVTGSRVKISCTLKKPDYSSVTQREWYRVESSERGPQDLTHDPRYTGRVSVSTRWSDCELTVRNVSVSDSGVYNFRFKTQWSDWMSASSGVHLTVTDLQLKVDPYSVSQSRVKVTCSAACSLSTSHFYWYRNDRYLGIRDRSIVLDPSKPYDEGSYACELDESKRSVSVCVLGKECWGVTYTRDRVCALKDTSIDLFCSYKHPAVHTVIKSVWFFKERADGEFVDVSEDEEYGGRVQYTQRSLSDCGLRISNLRKKDARTYRFRFYTDKSEHTGEPGISLSVTDLEIMVSDENRQRKLSCITTCTLPNYPTYIWYEDGRRVTYNNNKELFVRTGTVSSYSCAIRGHEELRSPAVHSPINTRAVVLSSGDTVQGDSVTLSCSSDANPPVHTYTWFKQRAAADTLLTTGQNYSIWNISSQHSGLYYCTADNPLGRHDSPPTLLNVLYSPINTRAVVLSSGDSVQGDSVTLSCSSDANPPVHTYTWFKQRAAADTLLTTGQNYSIWNISSQHSGLYYCTAHNPLGRHDSTPVHLDVLHAPRNVSVTVVRSVSGDRITLLCTSDSNPTSSYTWYRKTDGDLIPIGNATNVTLSSGAEGLYNCEARNRFGTSSSELSYTSGSSAVKYIGSGVSVVLLLSFIAVVLWMRESASACSIKSEQNSKNASAPVYDNISAMTSDPSHTASSEDQDTEVQYSSVYFKHSHTQDVPLYSTVQPQKALNQEEEVEYATVSLVKPRAVREDEVYINLQSEA